MRISVGATHDGEGITMRYDQLTRSQKQQAQGILQRLRGEGVETSVSQVAVHFEDASEWDTRGITMATLLDRLITDPEMRGAPTQGHVDGAPCAPNASPYGRAIPAPEGLRVEESK